MTTSNNKRRRMMPEVGNFKGRFRGPVIKRPKATKYTRMGIVTHREYAFSPSLDNVLYVGASSFNHTEIIGNLGIAFLRRYFMAVPLLRQVFQDVDEVIKYASVGQKFRVVFKFRHVHDDTESTFVAGDSPTAPFTDWFTATTTLKTAGLQLGAIIQHNWFDQKLLYQVTCYTNASDSFVPVNMLDVEDWQYHMYSCVSFKLQNVTPADDGAALQSTDITANPLQGRLFRFSGITPKVSSWNTDTLNWGTNLEDQASDDSGLILPATNPGDGWNTIPMNQVFKNCTNSMFVRLEPGHIKYTTAKFKFYGTMQKLMLGLFGSSDSDTVGSRESDLMDFGTSFVFALEKVMRTGQAAVHANCQLDVSCGCVAIPRMKLNANMEVTIGAAPPALPEVP